MRQYYLEAEASGCVAHVGLGGLAIRTLGPRPAKTIAPVNEWLLPRGNALSAYVMWPEDVAFTPGSAKLTARLFIGEPDAQVPKPSAVLAELTWPPERPKDAKPGQPAPPERYPGRLTQPFEIPSPTGCTLWDRAERIRQVGPGDQLEMMEAIRRFEQAAAERDPVRAFEPLRERFDDDARAYGKTPERLRDVAVEQLSWLFNQPGFAVKPLPKDEAGFDVVGFSEQLVRVTRNHGRPAVVMPIQGGEATLSLFMAKLAGHWAVARYV